MSGIKIVGGIIVIAGVALAGQWYTKEAYNSAVESQIKTGLKNVGLEGFSVKRDVVQSDFFSFNDTIQMEIAPSIVDPNGTLGLTEPWVMSYSSDCRIFPLYIQCDNRMNGITGLFPELASQFDDFSYSIHTDFNALTRTITSEFRSEAFSAEEDQARFDLKPIHLNTTSDFDFGEITFSGTFNGLDIATSGAAQGAVMLSDMSFEGEMSRAFDTVYTGRAHMTVSEYEMESAGQSVLSGTQASFTSVTAQQDDTFSVQYTASLDAVTTSGAMPMVLEDVNFDMKLSGVAAGAMKYLSGYSQSLETPEELTKFVDILGKQPLTLTLHDFSLTQNNAKATLSGSAKMAPFTMSDVQQGTFLQKLNATLNMLFDESFPQAVPALAPMLNQYIQMGVIQQNEAGKFESEVTLEDNTLKANGSVLSQF